MNLHNVTDIQIQNPLVLIQESQYSSHVNLLFLLRLLNRAADGTLQSSLLEITFNFNIKIFDVNFLFVFFVT